jgi:putative peptidoglycan lipid II flippase
VKKLIPSHFYKLKISKLSSEIYGFNFFKAVSLAAIGVSATQINSALDGVFAKFADPKGPIHLWFSIRIQQLPLALLSIGLISASTPRLCQLMALNQKDEAGHLCSSVASKLSILMMFLTCMIICLGDQIIRLLFEHGMFSEAATTQTLYCLIAYMVGLAPTSLSTVYASFFYALKEYKKPSIASIYALIANLVLNAVMIFVFHFGAWSVAATTSACSFLNAYLLKRSLKSENLVAPFSKKQVLMPSMTAIFSALILTVLKMIMPTMKPILSIPLLGLMYTGLYVAVCKLLAFHEPLELFTQFFKKRSIERV